MEKFANDDGDNVAQLIAVAGQVSQWFLQQARNNEKMARTKHLSVSTRDNLLQDAATYRRMSKRLDEAMLKAGS